MDIGAAHSAGLYNYPDDGKQFQNGCDAIWALGIRTLKVYCTSAYLTNYPKQTSWSSTPTTLTTLAQTTQFATQLGRGWKRVVLTTFPFATNPGGTITNWWRVNPTNANLLAEYNEVKALASHLLTTYASTGTEFVLQNWEGDWAYADGATSGAAAESLEREYADKYAAWLSYRQRAVEDARAANTTIGATVKHAIEVNRVLDSQLGRQRMVNTIASRVTPDYVSYSCYDSTIVDQGGWGASYAAWKAATEPYFRKATSMMRKAWPGVPLCIGEFGYPENEVPAGGSIAGMIADTLAWAASEGYVYACYWQVFDNEAGANPPTYRGYWLKQPDGSATVASAALQAAL